MNRQTSEAVERPSVAQLILTLSAVYEGSNSQSCIECVVKLPGNIECELNFIRVNTPRCGQFYGWLVQMTTADETNSFLLAIMGTAGQTTRMPVIEIELLGCLDRIDSRCLLSHQDLLNWIPLEFSTAASPARYRWIDFALALKD